MNAICCCMLAKELQYTNLFLSRNSVQASGGFSLEEIQIDISAPFMHESSSLDVNTTQYAKYARSSRKVEKDKVTLCGVRSSCNVHK